MLKRASGAMAVVIAAMAIVASTASAEIKWSHSSGTWQGTLTFKRNGGNARTCTFTSSHSMNLTNPAWFRAIGTLGWNVSCNSPASTMVWAPEGGAEGNPKEGYYLEFWDWLTFWSGEWRSSPWSDRTWRASVEGLEEKIAVVPFTNAAGGTPSQVTFNNTYLGETNMNEAVTATGTLKMLNGSTSVTLSGE